HYKDYSEWQNQTREKTRAKQQEKYWLKQFEGEIPELNLPTDYPRPVRRTFEGKTLLFRSDRGETAALKSTAHRQGATLYMVLRAIFDTFLSRLSGQEAIIIGTPVAGRGHADLNGIIGMFVNTLALRSYPGGAETYAGHLEKIKQNTLEAFENQDYPFEKLVEKLGINRENSRRPLFDVMFLMQNMELPEIEIPGLKLKPYHYENKTAKFELTLQGMEVGEELEFRLAYSTKLFEEETIHRYITYFKRMLATVPGEPGSKLAGIEILSPQEKQQILQNFNDTAARYPKTKTLAQLFEEQVEKSPGNLALAYENKQLTYKELNEKTNRLAERLSAEGAIPGSIVAMETERSLEMIIGIMAVLKTGAAYMPVAPEYPGDRKRYMIKDSGAKILIRKISRENLQEKLNADCKIIDININAPGDTNSFNTSNTFNTSELAYLIYTSGTTGKPKGAAIENRQVVNLVKALEKRIYRYGEPVGISLVSPYIFDASVKQIFPALLLGHTLEVVPEHIRFDGDRLVQFYKKKKIRVADGTPFHLKLILNAHRELGTDFPVQRFVIGGEQLERDQAEKIIRTIRRDDFKIVNVYGPTECCDVTTTYDIDMKTLSQERKVPIGKPIANVNVYIVGPGGNLQGIGIPGELWIGGNGLGRGYLNRPETTHERFIPNPFNKPAKDTTSTSGTPGTLYKTGDLARWRSDGNIEYLGRIDHQVKIRGFRIELGEIESQLLEHRDIKEAVVIVKGDTKGENKEDRYLCAYIVPAREIPVRRIREYLTGKLPAYMLPSKIAVIEAVPVTANGKIDRRALPEPGKETAGTFIAPQGEVEKTLADLWAQALKIDIKQIGIDDNFFHLGGHSLKAMQLTAKIHNRLNVALQLPQLFAKPTIRALAAYIETAAQEKFQPIKAVEKKKYYPLSPAQKRMYLLQQMENSGTGYNMPLAVLLEGDLERKRLEKTFRKLLERHESFRTAFDMREGEAVQVIYKAAALEFGIRYYGNVGGGEREEAVIEEFIRPFDLTRAPLVRAALLERETGAASTPAHILILDMHHIISDGVSFGIFVGDFIKLFNNEELSPLEIQYKDFSEWQNNRVKTRGLKKEQAWWRQKFERELEVLELPYDYPRPPLQSFAGSSIYSEIGKQQAAGIRELAVKEEATLFMVVN
ncbi:MAG: amino acid adenylation domain-containing protein, partial [bacterium]|nr:amino acid adenylation domain-containing protein [bacterium]